MTSSTWNETDALLITYADMIQATGTPPLRVLRSFLRDRIGKAFSSVHILPFFPSSSDDGFSVKHYRLVDPSLGQWEDLQAIATDYKLMCDLVLNHTSRESRWFSDFCAGVAPARDYFITTSPTADISQVVRPRSHALITAVPTRGGTKHVWTTFSTDQIDLNFANPDVLFEMLDIALFYVLNGARILRLDAIAYLWKRVGTPCIHLPETHEVVKLLRNLLEIVAPNVWLITETNVPHTENVSYFGDSHETHMVYQFSLPPLVLVSLIKGDTTHLSAWAANLASPPTGCTYLNFTASHDGIGLRPLEKLVPTKWIEDLIKHVEVRKGCVSSKSNSDGTLSPYELNISWFDALSDPEGGQPELQARRFLCSQMIALALQGIPATYFHSLFATPNSYEDVALTGQARSINRRKYRESDLAQALDNPASVSSRILSEYLRCLHLRATCKAFHPEASQRVHVIDPRLFVVEREYRDAGSRLLAISNCSATEMKCEIPERLPTTAIDVLSGKKLATDSPIPLGAYETLWLIASH